MSIYIEKTADTQYLIYTKSNGDMGWFEFLFENNISPTQHQNIWRNTLLKHCILNKANPAISGVKKRHILDITQPGQWEYAFKLDGFSDFVSGIHGYEETNSLALETEDTTLNMEVGDVVTANTITITRNSTILSRIDLSDIVNASSIYTYSENGLNIKSTIEWLVDGTVTLFYWPMLPASRASNVTSMAQLDGQTVQDVSQQGFAEIHANSAKCMFWNLKNGFNVVIQILNPLDALNNYENNGILKTWVADSHLYNKVYFARVAESTNICTEDIWTCEATFYPEFPRQDITRASVIREAVQRD